MSDNFHQSVNGGTGANHIMLGHGDAIWFSDGNGHPRQPPHHVEVAIGTANQGVVDEVENPNAAAGTNNWYSEDGYGGGSVRLSLLRRRLVQQLLRHQPAGRRRDRDVPALAAAPDRSALRARPLLPAEQLQPGLLRQRQQRLHRHQPEQHGVHHSAILDAAASATTCCDAHVSWKYYGDQWNNYVPRPLPAQLRGDRQEYRRVLQHLQPVPVRHVDHVTTPTGPQRAHPGHRRTCTRTSPTARCRRSPSSSRAAWSTAIRRLRSSTCSRASPRRSSMRCAPIHGSGKTPPSSSPSMRAAATTTRATCSRSTSSATARAFR